MSWSNLLDWFCLLDLCLSWCSSAPWDNLDWTNSRKMLTRLRPYELHTDLDSSCVHGHSLSAEQAACVLTNHSDPLKVLSCLNQNNVLSHSLKHYLLLSASNLCTLQRRCKRTKFACIPSRIARRSALSLHSASFARFSRASLIWRAFARFCASSFCSFVSGVGEPVIPPS